VKRDILLTSVQVANPVTVIIARTIVKESRQYFYSHAVTKTGNTTTFTTPTKDCPLPHMSNCLESSLIFPKHFSPIIQPTDETLNHHIESDRCKHLYSDHVLYFSEQWG
jgi:hypothetical protein